MRLHLTGAFSRERTTVHRASLQYFHSIGAPQVLIEMALAIRALPEGGVVDDYVAARRAAAIAAVRKTRERFVVTPDECLAFNERLCSTESDTHRVSYHDADSIRILATNPLIYLHPQILEFHDEDFEMRINLMKLLNFQQEILELVGGSFDTVIPQLADHLPEPQTLRDISGLIQLSALR